MKNVIYWVADRRFLALAIGNARRVAPTVRPGTTLHIFYEDENAQAFETDGIKVHANALRPFLGDDLPAYGWPRIVWGHLFALHQFDADVERVLYLDSDAFPTRPINAIFDVDLEGKDIAAVADAGFIHPDLGYAKTDFEEHGRKAGVDCGHYFNAGMVMFDRAAAARIDFIREVSDYIRVYGPNATYSNQDFLNHLFRGHWQELSPRWNFQAGALLGYGFEHVVRPNIIHFTDSHRPWHGKSFIHDPVHARRALALIDNEFRAEFGLRPRNASVLGDLGKDLIAARNGLMVALGIRYRRVQRQWDMWHQRRDICWDYLETALRDGRFADVRQGISRFDVSTIPEKRRIEPRWHRTGYTVPSALEYEL
ncbi:MAG: glycosyltransferase [Zavarzinia sp.]|nr:glycosyltransferase [Zavarzinia sp.]